MGQKFATLADLQHEDQIAALLEQQWNCTLKKPPDRCYVDFMMFRGKTPRALIEVKWRTYDTLQDLGRGPYMSLIKYTMAMGMANRVLIPDKALPFIFVVRVKTGVFFAELKGKYEVEWGGSSKRGESEMEPNIIVPPGDFKQIRLPDHNEFIENVVEKTFGPVEIIQ